MALKRKLSKAEFEVLNESLRGEYKEKDGNYFLDVDDATELINTLERLKSENKGNVELVAQLNQQIEEKQQEIARKNGDMAAVDKEWKKKLDETSNQHKNEIEALKSVARDGYLKSILDQVTPIFNLPERHVLRDFSERIQVTFENGKPMHKVLGKDGNVSELTIGDLTKEFVDNPDYSPYIIQSRASGGTPPSGNPPSGSGVKNFSEMTLVEQEAHLKSKHKNLQG